MCEDFSVYLPPSSLLAGTMGKPPQHHLSAKLTLTHKFVWASQEWSMLSAWAAAPVPQGVTEIPLPSVSHMFAVSSYVTGSRAMRCRALWSRPLNKRLRERKSKFSAANCWPSCVSTRRRESRGNSCEHNERGVEAELMTVTSLSPRFWNVWTLYRVTSHLISLTRSRHSHQETPAITQRLMSQASLAVTQREPKLPPPLKKQKKQH